MGERTAKLFGTTLQALGGRISRGSWHSQPTQQNLLERQNQQKRLCWLSKEAH